MLPGIVMALAQLAPSVIGLIGGSKAKQVAETVVETATRITGAGSAEDAYAALKADPEKLLAYQAEMNAQALALYQEETKRLETVNATMRVEATAADPWVRRWRPTFGYVVAATWAAQVLAVAYVTVADPARAAPVIGAMAELSTMWSVALAVLGIGVWKRSSDKKVAAGAVGAGPLVDAVASRIGR